MRLIAALVTVAAFSSCSEETVTKTLAPGGPSRAVGSNGAPLAIEFFLQAHQDDWQLFYGDRVVDAVHTAGKVVIVFTTAGAQVGDPAYAQAREQAANASVDTMTLATAGPWACANATVSSHTIYRCTRANTVSYYLRLPNPGDARPNGLSDLRDGRISSLSSVDGSATYTSWTDLRTTIQGIFAAEIGSTAESAVGIHSPETDRSVNDSDHSDHLATGDLTDAACVGHDFNRFWYIGYQNQYYPQNVFGSALAAKWGTVYAYDHVMVRLIGETIIGTSSAEVWVPRTIERIHYSAGSPPPPTVPNAPSSLVASPAVGASISLTWTDNAANEDGFNIERAPDAGGVAGTYAQIASVGPNVQTYSNTGLDANVRYWYRVVAYNSVGPSTYSNEASAILSTPNPPSGLAATAISTTRIDLSWTDNSADESGFQIERAPDVGGVAGTFAQIASVGANVVTYSNTGLTVGTSYWYRVRAYNSIGTSAYSAAVSVTPIAAVVAPSGLTATAVSGTRINLAWTDNSNNESGFRIERAADAGGVPGTFAQFASVGTNVASYGNTGLSNGTRYWYRVRAYNSGGASAYSNIADATTMSLPAAPTNLLATASIPKAADVSWTDNADNETSYRLERAPDNAGAPGSFSLVATLGANATSYQNTALASSTSYWYRVRAQNSVGNSAWAPAVRVTTLPPVPPGNLAVRAYLVGTTRYADLTWTPGSESKVDVWRAGTRLKGNVNNTGGPLTYTSGSALGNSVPYQICISGKTDAASCTQVVYANY